MKNLYSLLLLIITLSLSAQTKQQLIDSIIKVNELQSDCVGAVCSEGISYKRFQALKKMLSTDELRKLAVHNNSALRMYAVEEDILNHGGDPSKYLKQEIKRKTTVTEYDGCTMGDERTDNVVYHIYWNHIGGGNVGGTPAFYGMEAVKADPVHDSIFRANKYMMRMDSLILAQDKSYWLLYTRAFANRKFPERFIPRIEELAFKHNNSIAMDYLVSTYPDKYTTRMRQYWEKEFPKAKFKGEDEFYFTEIAGKMLETKEEHLKKLVIAQLKNVKYWDRYKWFSDVLAENGIDTSKLKSK